MAVCRKVRFRDRIAAELALASIARRDNPRRAYSERRAYECPACGGWHLTSWTKDAYQSLQDAPESPHAGTSL